MLLRLRSALRSRFALAGLLAGLSLFAASAAAAARPVVAELYTSQGCSSCPPADALLARLANRTDVLALSLPITYWDMLGWKDTLASKANTERQKAYAAAMGRGGIYTPQMIIDGVNDLVGSRENDVIGAIAAREADMQDIPVTLDVTADQVHIAVAAAPGKTASDKTAPGDTAAGDDATIWLFRIRPKTTVKIGGGENKGHTVTYRNVVRAIKAVGMWKGDAVSADLPRAELGGEETDSFAVVVQKNGYGRIIGAAEATMPARKHGKR